MGREGLRPAPHHAHLLRIPHAISQLENQLILFDTVDSFTQPRQWPVGHELELWHRKSQECRNCAKSRTHKTILIVRRPLRLGNLQIIHARNSSQIDSVYRVYHAFHV